VKSENVTPAGREANNSRQTMVRLMVNTALNLVSFYVFNSHIDTTRQQYFPNAFLKSVARAQNAPDEPPARIDRKGLQHGLPPNS
jgi:hypothetical protein